MSYFHNSVDLSLYISSFAQHILPAVSLYKSLGCGEDKPRRNDSNVWTSSRIRQCWLERDDPPKHSLLPSTINSPQCQEFMVSRIFSVVSILLRPLMDEFTLKNTSINKCNFYHKTTQQDGHYTENPSNHELLTVRGGDCRASKKMFRGILPPY